METIPETFPDIILPKGHPRSPENWCDVTLHFYKRDSHKDYLSYQIWWVEGQQQSMIDIKWSPYYFYREPQKGTESYGGFGPNDWTLRWWSGLCGDRMFKARTPQEAYEQVCSLIVKGWRLKRKGM
jgi:hypothetical protein